MAQAAVALPGPDCGVKTWPEETDGIASRAALTESGPGGDLPPGRPVTVTRRLLARQFGMSWHARWGRCETMADPESTTRRANPCPRRSGSTRRRSSPPTPPIPPCWSPGSSNWTAPSIDVVAGRCAAAASNWLAAKPERWLACIATAFIDPHAGYARGLAEARDARLVADHSTPAPWQPVPRRGASAGPAVHPRPPGLEGRPALPHPPPAPGRPRPPAPRSFERMLRCLRPAIRPARWPAAYLAKELLREVHATTDIDEAIAASTPSTSNFGQAEVRELTRLSRTIHR